MLCSCVTFSVKTNCEEKELCILKGLGHAILGNFSTDQIAIQLNKILK